MSNKISSETKRTVLDMFRDGESKRNIAKECGISPRSVGRIIDNAHETKKAMQIKAPTNSVKPVTKNIDGLLPCPFCGGEGKIRATTCPPGDEMGYYVKCGKCGLMTVTVKIGKQLYSDKEFSTVEAVGRVTELWNNRYNKEGASVNE